MKICSYKPAFKSKGATNAEIQIQLTMPEGTSNSLVNLGDFGKPADTLIKKVSKAVGGIFAPYQIKKIAKAEAEAAMIKAQSEIEITDLHRRAMHRFVEEEAQKQKNIEDITAKAIPHLNEGANPDSMNDDWVSNFFDKSRIVSDAEMQSLWSRVLAGEANNPGTFSKRTVNFLAGLDKYDAELFSKLCGFAWVINGLVPLIFDIRHAIYTKSGINFNALSHLENIGLIQFDGIGVYSRINLSKEVTALYYGRRLHLELPKENGNQIEVGHALFTKTGMELAPISGSKALPEFWDHVNQRWKAHIKLGAT